MARLSPRVVEDTLRSLRKHSGGDCDGISNEPQLETRERGGVDFTWKNHEAWPSDMPSTKKSPEPIIRSNPWSAWPYAKAQPKAQNEMAHTPTSMRFCAESGRAGR